MLFVVLFLRERGSTVFFTGLVRDDVLIPSRSTEASYNNDCLIEKRLLQDEN